MSRRMERINEEIRGELARLLREEATDPRIGLVTITRVDVSPDLHNALVFYSPLELTEDRDDEPEAGAGLESAAPFLRRRLAQLLPDLPADIRRLRLMFMSTNVFHGVAEVASLAHTPLGDMSHFDNETLLDHLVDYLIGGLQAPHSHAQLKHREKRPSHDQHS